MKRFETKLHTFKWKDVHVSYHTRYARIYACLPSVFFFCNLAIFLNDVWKFNRVGTRQAVPFDMTCLKYTFTQISCSVYGTSECGVLLCSTGKGKASGKTVGWPFPFVELKINPENNEIFVKSATAMEEGFMETGS